VRHLKRLAIFLSFVLAILLLVAGSASGQQKPGVFGDPEVWHWAPSRTYHVENYRLALHFDQAKGEVFGDEVVTLRPFEPHFRSFYLDSSELTIESVSLEPAHGAPAKLTFTQQDPRLSITLDRDYDPSSTLNVRIVYHGFPRTGLFFVNPTPSYPAWPREVYSQGEPELNHYWFPCWDFPNDMATSETVTIVPEGQTVVSNGTLVKVTHSAGEVSYDWVESVPHSSYLVSIAVGPWRKVSDSYENKPVDYYVPGNVDEATARRSFHLTPDMIGFFSRATGIDYPYEQYAQTTVQNFMFGGQENVSATTLTDATLHDERADQDYPSTNLVSHELGQHWFGDFVQGRDWANIWLNEGFATYLEALYTQYHEGYGAYRLAMYEDQQAEQSEERDQYRRPIVDRHYNDPLDMFDATTHEKGAAVLDMLRYLIDGPDAASRAASQDEPFFQALRSYLVAHRAQAADTADLIAALRTTTGSELDWFFREWVFMPGHPDYKVEASYDPARKIEKLGVRQVQQTDDGTPVFDMPVELAFYGANGQQKKVQIRDYLQQQTFEIPLDFEPLWVDFDPDCVIDKTVDFKQPVNALIAEAEKDPSTMSRLSAVQQLSTTMPEDTDARVDALAHVLAADSFYAVRAAAAGALGRIGTDKAKGILLSQLEQADSRVRAAIVEALGNFSRDPAVFSVLRKQLQEDPSYAVQAAAAKGLGRSGMEQAFDVLRAETQATPELHVFQATLRALAATKDARAAELLLALAQPGQPLRIRVSALAGLENLKDQVAKDSSPLSSAVEAALHDPFFPLREIGEELVGALALSQFEPELESEAQKAPMAMERDAARRALEQLHPH
jgi:aminopeptidase N